MRLDPRICFYYFQKEGVEIINWARVSPAIQGMTQDKDGCFKEDQDGPSTIVIPRSHVDHFNEHPGWWATLKDLSHLERGHKVDFHLHTEQGTKVVVAQVLGIKRPGYSEMDTGLSLIGPNLEAALESYEKQHATFILWWVLFYEVRVETQAIPDEPVKKGEYPQLDRVLADLERSVNENLELRATVRKLTARVTEMTEEARMLRTELRERNSQLETLRVGLRQIQSELLKMGGRLQP